MISNDVKYEFEVFHPSPITLNNELRKLHFCASRDHKMKESQASSADICHQWHTLSVNYGSTITLNSEQELFIELNVDREVKKVILIPLQTQ